MQGVVGNRAIFCCRDIAEGCFGGADKTNKPSLIKRGMSAKGKQAELLPFGVAEVILGGCREFLIISRKRNPNTFLLLVKSDKFAPWPVAESK